MRHGLKVFATALCTAAAIAACAGQPSEETLAKEQAVRDFIAVRGLEEADTIRVSDRDGWTEITIRFLIYHSRRNDYLLEFRRLCHELRDNTRIVPDVRDEPNLIRARFDTLRGCRIHRIYPLTEAEAAELKEIGDSPGARE